MANSKSNKVLRVAVVVDGVVCDTLHQTRPGSVTVGHELEPEVVSGFADRVGRENVGTQGGVNFILPLLAAVVSLFVAVSFRANLFETFAPLLTDTVGEEVSLRTRDLNFLSAGIVGLAFAVAGLYSGLLSRQKVGGVLAGVIVGAVVATGGLMAAAMASYGNMASVQAVGVQASVVALVFGFGGALLGSYFKGSARPRLHAHQGGSVAKNYRQRAPIWLGLGLLLVLGGIGAFAFELKSYNDEVAATQAAMEAGEIGPEGLNSFNSNRGLTGWPGALLVILGLVPLVTGLVGITEPEPPKKDSEPKRASGVPASHPMFDYVDGTYYLDVPKAARGKITLGKKSATIAQLRKKFGKGDQLRVTLSNEAKGKLIIGDNTFLMFQFDDPAPVPAYGSLPEGVRSIWVLFAVAPLMALCWLFTSIILGGLFAYLTFAEATEPEVSDRMREMTGVKYEEEEEVEEPEETDEEEEEDVLKQEDDEPEEVKDDEKVDPSVNVPLDQKPKKYSDKAVKEARGVGVARVLGTYGGPGEGTVFDVIESTENNLGDLFAQGMTQTVYSDGGEVSPFVAGGEGIEASGAMVQNDGLKTDEQPGVEKKVKKEKKVKGKAKGTTGDISGDIDKKAVKATIKHRMSALQHCYEKALRTKPSLKGKMTFTIDINIKGKVTKVKVESDSVGDSTVKSCTTSKIKGWRFPVQGAEDSAQVTFSVVFSGA